MTGEKAKKIFEQYNRTSDVVRCQTEEQLSVS